LRELKRQYPNDTLYFIIGEDEARQINLWHRFEDMQDYADFIIVRRVLEEKKIDLKYFGNSIFADNPVIEISSTYIRTLVKEGKTLANLTPEAVIEVIKREKLYRA
jgi:nicotinate-nucleotide adenylyltransferase